MGLARPAVFIAEERPLCLHNKIAYSLTVSECRTTELSLGGVPTCLPCKFDRDRDRAF